MNYKKITLPDPAGHFTAWLGRPLSRLEATVIRQLEYLRYRHLPVKLLINDPDPDSNRIPLLLVTYFRYLDEHLHLPSFPLVAVRTKSHAQLLTRRLRKAKHYSAHAPNSLRGANANHLLILNAHTYPHSRIPAHLVPKTASICRDAACCVNPLNKAPEPSYPSSLKGLKGFSLNNSWDGQF